MGFKPNAVMLREQPLFYHASGHRVRWWCGEGKRGQ